MNLQFHTNDVIRVIEIVNNDWYRGELNANCGIFPSSFVQRAELNGSKTNTVTALYDYNSGIFEDLIFRKGDVIEVVEWISDDWLRGKLNGLIGLVPTTYIKQTQQPKMGAKSTKFCSYIVTAKYDYLNSSSDHLCFSKGDKIEIIEEVDSIKI